MFLVAGGCCRDGWMVAEMCIRDPVALSTPQPEWCHLMLHAAMDWRTNCRLVLTVWAGTKCKHCQKADREGQTGHQSLLSHRDGPYGQATRVLHDPLWGCAPAAATGAVLMWVWPRAWKTHRSVLRWTPSSQGDHPLGRQEIQGGKVLYIIESFRLVNKSKTIQSNH